MESVGFKEWAIVCEALGRGEQSIILRKGGIAEGRDGFAFRHNEFFLFPTFFHEQVEKVRNGGVLPSRPDGEAHIHYFAKVERSCVTTQWAAAAALSPLHVLREELVRERFEYDQAPGVHVAFVRVYQLNPRWSFPDAANYGGCRSWVTLPPPPDALEFHAVLAVSQHAARAALFERAIGVA